MKPSELLQPLSVAKSQVFLGRGLHTLGLIGWVLEQIGKADIIVTTFSTSTEFLSGFSILRKKGLVGSAAMVADLKAAKKTQKLFPLLDASFDEVYLTENHSKIVLLTNGSDKISIISSQNNTYGGRIECTLVTSDHTCFNKLMMDYELMISKSYKRK